MNTEPKFTPLESAWIKFQEDQLPTTHSIVSLTAFHAGWMASEKRHDLAHRILSAIAGYASKGGRKLVLDQDMPDSEESWYEAVSAYLAQVEGGGK